MAIKCMRLRKDLPMCGGYEAQQSNNQDNKRTRTDKSAPQMGINHGKTLWKNGLSSNSIHFVLTKSRNCTEK